MESGQQVLNLKMTSLDKRRYFDRHVQSTGWMAGGGSEPYEFSLSVGRGQTGANLDRVLGRP